jgi:SAM-dependent methyltransferase
MTEWNAVEYAYHSQRIGWYGQVAEAMLDLVGPADCLIDFACGTGRAARLLLARGPGRHTKRIYLVDRSQAMIDATSDLEAPGVEVFRHVDDEKLSSIPATEHGRVDAIVCAHAFHLLRDERQGLTGARLVRRAATLLRPNGSLVVCIPDQAWRFDDGWSSCVYQQACDLWGPSPGRENLQLLSRDLLAQWAVEANLNVSTATRAFRCTWNDFIRFYAIPGIGTGRAPGADAQERWDYLENLGPRFEEIEYRFVFACFTRAGRDWGGGASPSVREESAGDSNGRR